MTRPRPQPPALKSDVLFVCSQGAGRSQMAQAFFERMAPADVRACAAGSAPADVVWPTLVGERLAEFRSGGTAGEATVWLLGCWTNPKRNKQGCYEGRRMSERLPDGAWLLSDREFSDFLAAQSDEQRVMTEREGQAAHELRGRQREAFEYLAPYLFDRREFMSTEVAARRLGMSHEDAHRLFDEAYEAVAERVDELRRKPD